MLKCLFPKIAAFKQFRTQVNEALQLSEQRFVEFARSTLDSLIPDNDNFTIEDARMWEKKLGIVTNELTSLSDRKAAIRRKMAHPGNMKYRQSAAYIEHQLQMAGFNVKVYENRFFEGGQWITKTPEQILGLTPPQHGTDNQHSESLQHASGFINKVANYIDRTKDADFIIGDNYRFTFFISSTTDLATPANIPASRELELRQLVLILKPLHTCAFLIVNYI